MSPSFLLAGSDFNQQQLAINRTCLWSILNIPFHSNMTAIHVCDIYVMFQDVSGIPLKIPWVPPSHHLIMCNFLKLHTQTAMLFRLPRYTCAYYQRPDMTLDEAQEVSLWLCLWSSGNHQGYDKCQNWLVVLRCFKCFCLFSPIFRDG